MLLGNVEIVEGVTLHLLDGHIRNPASAKNSNAFCSPHIAPRPSPFLASETVMQCMVETVYKNGPMGWSRFSCTSLEALISTMRNVPPCFSTAATFFKTVLGCA